MFEFEKKKRKKRIKKKIKKKKESNSRKNHPRWDDPTDSAVQQAMLVLPNVRLLAARPESPPPPRKPTPPVVSPLIRACTARHATTIDVVHRAVTARRP